MLNFFFLLFIIHSIPNSNFHLLLLVDSTATLNDVISGQLSERVMEKRSHGLDYVRSNRRTVQTLSKIHDRVGCEIVRQCDHN